MPGGRERERERKRTGVNGERLTALDDASHVRLAELVLVGRRQPHTCESMSERKGDESASGSSGMRVQR